jgi:hypothetical protein
MRLSKYFEVAKYLGRFLFAIVASNVFGQTGDLVSFGTNSWIFHTPDDGRRSLHIAPFTNGDWDWHKQIYFLNNGDIVASGNIHIPLASSFGYIQSTDLFTHNGNTIGNYSLGWANDSWTQGAPTAYLSAYGGIKLFTAALPRLVVTHSGNVGIGTNSPSPNAKLDIQGGSVNIGGVGPADAVIHIKTSSFNQWGRLTQMSPSEPNKSALNLMASKSTIGADQWWAWGVSTDNKWRIHAGTDFYAGKGLTVDEVGNVGIGTENPQQKLHVKGTVYSTEVKVDVAAGTGPDYVFSNNYPLPTLDYLKSYIAQHQHLPEVPSAKEMETNGVQLGEMNMLLLKKVEELTLYVIEQQRKLDEQKQKSDAQIKMLLEKIETVNSKR